MSVLRRKECWAIAWLLLIIAMASAAPVFLKTRAEVLDFTQILEAPSPAHPLGTDSLGRDLLARILCGAGVSLSVGFVAVFLSVLVGTLIGALAGYAGGWIDRLLMSITDVMLCFPVFFFILAVIAFLGPGIANIMLVIGLTSWMGTARLVRAEILTLKEREFILAARAYGAGRGRIIFRHLLPNALSPIIVNAVLGISSAILLESGLSFLGIGVQPPTPSWGNILTDGKAALGVAWWLTVYPGVMIFLTVLSANILGESLREHFKGLGSYVVE